MSRLNELIQELCPNGVEYKRLGDICLIETGKLNANAAVDGGAYPFFTTSKQVSYINSWRWDCDALLVAGNANVGDVKHYCGKFEAYQRTYVLSRFSSDINSQFLYYVMASKLKEYLSSKKNEAAMTYIVLSTLQSFPIPIPPLEIQQEIVKILDKFTQLQAELQAELELRSKQYEHYRNELLSFDNGLASRQASRIRQLINQLCPNGVEYKPLGEVESDGIIKLGRGNVISKKDIAEHPGNYPIYSSSAVGNGEFGRYGRYMFSEPLISWSIDGGGKFFLRTDGKYSLTNVCGWLRVIDEYQIDIRYLYYVLINEWQGKEYNYTHKAHPSVIRNDYTIPLPPLKIQQEIVKILDKFSIMVSDISIGLPAEIKLRQQQYEYYRDKLLTFAPFPSE